MQRIVAALQGDDEMNGGELQDSQDVELDEPGGWEEPGRGFETAKGAEADLRRNWTVLKEWVGTKAPLIIGTFSRQRRWDTDRVSHRCPTFG